MTQVPDARAAKVMRPTTCALCGEGPSASLLYPQSFDADDLSPVLFSARREPDRRHFRIVRCDSCGLVRSDPVATSATLAGLYANSHFDYGDEVANLVRTYGKYLRKLEHLGASRNGLLEIGCGNGFFLCEALAQGYTDVRGVEPSRDALQKALPEIRPLIVPDVMRPGLFAEGQFSVACFFQVFDHLPNPREILEEMHRIVRPDGFLLFIHHNTQALSARLLGERSPIIDIEHTYLYSPATMARILAQTGFEVVAGGAARNSYSMRYVAHLLPLPAILKRPLHRFLDGPAGSVRLTIALGNLFVVARRR